MFSQWVCGWFGHTWGLLRQRGPGVYVLTCLDCDYEHVADTTRRRWWERDRP
jgi:hypothetical protein